MRRIWIASLLSFALTGTFGASGGVAAADAGPVTVIVDLVAAAHSTGDPQCDVRFCTSQSEAWGLTVDGPRLWHLSVTYTSQSGHPGSGAWALTAVDGSGDGLSGDFLEFLGSTRYWRMEVESGQGAYAGYVDAVAGGQDQNYPGSVTLPWYGRFDGPPFGSMRFDLVPAA